MVLLLTAEKKNLHILIASRLIISDLIFCSFVNLYALSEEAAAGGQQREGQQERARPAGPILAAYGGEQPPSLRCTLPPHKQTQWPPRIRQAAKQGPMPLICSMGAAGAAAGHRRQRGCVSHTFRCILTRFPIS